MASQEQEFLLMTNFSNDFPQSAEVLEALKTILKFLGEDPDREGLKDTPQRILRSWSELFIGYKQDREKILCTTFNDYGKYDGIVMLKNIDFASYCEHHFLPFYGQAHVAYMPDTGSGGGVVGLSKLARLVDMHSKRLQIQEKMTYDIATDLQEVLKPVGVGVVIEAKHSCMGCRGVKKPNGIMVTSHVTGVFREDTSLRQEWLDLLGRDSL